MNRLKMAQWTVAPFLFLLVAVAVVSSEASVEAAPRKSHVQMPKACVRVINACRAGGFNAGPGNKHPGQGLFSDCVQPISKGSVIKGVVGVSKGAAQACLKARRHIRSGAV